MKIAHIELSNKHKTLGKLQNIRDLEGGWAVLPFKQHPVVSIEDQATCLEVKVTEMTKEIADLGNGHLEKKALSRGFQIDSEKGKVFK